MFDHRHYVPILRWKRGEQRALRELYPNDKLAMTPLAESLKDENKEPADIANEVAKNWGTARMFFDLGPSTTRTPSSSNHPVPVLFNNARVLALKLIPVTSLNRNTAYQRAVTDVVAQDKRGACVRLFRGDIARPTLGGDLAALSASLRLQPSSIDLVLDLQIFESWDQNIARFCQQIPNLSDWRTFTIASGSFPQNLTGLPVGQHLLPRAEWRSWRNQITASLPRLPAYGDYATLHPFLTSWIPGMNVSASIRYTYDEDWVVMRGEGLRNKDGPGSAQYPANAELLIGRPEYRGQFFSYGDNYIYQIALNKDKPGNPETWLTTGVNHHLSFAVRQISNLFGSSKSA